MNRKDFIKKGFTMVSSLPLLVNCADASVKDTTADINSNDSQNGSNSNNCTTTNSETAGPFPTKNPSSFIYQDISLDRTGTPLSIHLAIKNKSTDCGAYENARVDIWHCDADGSYSEYGGSGMQSTNYTNAHFLRGRQITDGNGHVLFKSIFPGWYSGRAVHIHVEIFNSSGKSILITQIAFPKEICDAIYTNSPEFYKKGKANTSNENDGVFRDGFDSEMASIKGNIKDGFELSHTIVVNG